MVLGSWENVLNRCADSHKWYYLSKVGGKDPLPRFQAGRAVTRNHHGVLGDFVIFLVDAKALSRNSTRAERISH